MRIFGAVIIFVCCGYIGFSMVTAHKKEEQTLHQIIAAISYMECEMHYRLTPLPQLLGQAGKQTAGITGEILARLSSELESQISPDVSCCMEMVLRCQKDVPKLAGDVFETLGKCLGRFDLEGQLRDFESVRTMCQQHLIALETNRDNRLHSYQTLGLCAGAALAILLL